MRQVPRTRAMLVGFFVTVWLLASGLVVAAQAARSTPALTAAQATACIQAAVAAQPGTLKNLDVKDTGGTRLCRVTILADDGKTHHLQVDATTNRVVSAK
jgi:uncharacterized membrane protein YkoI